MLTPRSTLTRRVLAALDAVPARIPVLVGGCGIGKTTIVQLIRDRIGRGATQYIDVERTASTPERFFRAVAAASPFPVSDQIPAGARQAFDATLGFLTRAKTGGGELPVFVLDEFLELRTFESFPGLRRVLHELVDGLGASANRFVLTSRYTARAARLLRDRSARFELIPVAPLTAEDTLDMLGLAAARDTQDADYLARTVHALADGRPLYVRALGDELTAAREHGGPDASDPISALASVFAAGGRLSRECSFCYELRLHRARGYGALKAILEILAAEEALTLTEISLRLQRTPGSTKDYLSWLEDVDLVISRHKRYSFADPLLRLWVRLHCRASAATDDDLAREIHRYALPRMPPHEPSRPEEAHPTEPAYAMAGPSGIIEID